ncbi:DUF4124 domain-containing protein [Cellvibrio mixtus]|uniref:DUF4124 domain-containing protein n=1 Tax=Cellvibrio mixtus TaxID=39650 RepID=UPI000587F3F3|nr:DUF4124 domain-containing protein [Cellvibrio mixtus]
MKFSSVLMASSVLLMAVTLSNPGVAKDGKVYTWTDTKGVVHYGEHPPKDVQAKLVKTRTGHSDPTPVSATPTPQNAPQEQADSGDANSLKDPERCTKARQNLEIIDSGAPIRTTNEKGEKVIMDDAEKAKQRAMFQAVANQAC